MELLKSVGREYFESLVIAVVLALFIRTFVVQAFKIPTGSMEQNLLIGDHLLVNKFVFGPTLSPLRRDSADERHTPNRRHRVRYVPKSRAIYRRYVIGLPGETVELRNKRVFINGQRLDEPYVYFLEDPPPIPQEAEQSSDLQIVSGDPRVQYGPVTVPPGHYFVMGDNRDNSPDVPLLGVLTS